MSNPKNPDANASIKKGRVFIYRLFDAAQEIDLSRVEQKEREAAKRLKFSKIPYMKALQIANPPLSFDLKPFSRPLFGQEQRVNVVAKAFDFGVISIAFEITLPEGATFAGLEREARAFSEDPSIDRLATDYALQLLESLGDTVTSPEIKGGFIEDYTIFFIEDLGGGMDAPGLLSRYDPERLLLNEERALSAFTKRETLRHSFSYYPDDLIIVHIDNAFIIDPTGSTDLPDILEFANAQLLELRYYDHVIDRELSWIYKELSTRSVTFFRLGEYERLAKKIARLVAEMTEVTEKVNNALKVTEDIYYARIYRTFMSILRCREWEESIRDKIDIISNTYKMLHDEISARRAYAIELSILILIAIDIALVLANR